MTNKEFRATSFYKMLLGFEDSKVWCSCGAEALVYIWLRDALVAIRDLPLGTFAKRYDEAAAAILMGQLDILGLVEHGTSWRCSWLTERGKEACSMLEVMSDDEIDAALEAANDAGIAYRLTENDDDL